MSATKQTKRNEKQVYAAAKTTTSSRGPFGGKRGFETGETNGFTPEQPSS